MDKSENKQGYSLLYHFIIGFWAILSRLLFFTRIIGRENLPREGAVILMGNHQAFLDPLMLAICDRKRDMHFMGKKELFEKPIWNYLFTKVHGFPVDRGNMDMGAIRTAMGVLKDGNTLGIFPEGTRSKTGHMLPLLGGASLLALKSGCEVVPVYIDGRYRLFHPMKVIIGKPIEMDDLRQGRMNKESCDALTARMTAAFAELSNGRSLPPAEEQTEENA